MAYRNLGDVHVFQKVILPIQGKQKTKGGYMKTTIETRKKKLLAFCLSVLMVSSAAMGFASCTDDTTSDSSVSEETSSDVEETTEADDGLTITNSNFATFNTNNGLNVIGTTVSGWTRSVNSTASGSAVSSTAASGIINTEAAAWNKLTQMTNSTFAAWAEKDTLTADEQTSAANAIAALTETDWDGFSALDKLNVYDVWDKIDANAELEIADEFDLYEKLNVTKEQIDIDIANPGTHTGAADSNILMIHNEYSKNKAVGTAQKFTSSSSVSVPAGTAAKFSVWVKTADLQSASTTGEAQDAVQKGAYISITHSVGSSSLDAYQVKNIQADEWTKYEFYLRSSSYADSTFNIVLGLGQGGGTDRLEYVNGYAFFDDISYETLTSEAFATATTSLDSKYVATFESTKDEKTINAWSEDGKAFAMDFFAGNPAAADSILNNLTIGKTKMENGGEYNYNLDASKDVTKVFANSAAILTEAENNEYLTAVYNNFFKDSTFAANEKVLMLLSSNGTAYTATSSAEIGFNGHDYVAVSFYVKTSNLNGKTGASITLNDGDNKTQFTSIDTSSYTAVQIGDDEDAYDGWQKCFFFVSNDTENDDATFTLDFGFGPLTITDTTTKDSFYEGFAAFTKFEIHYIDTKAEFECASAGTYAKVVSLKGDVEDEETTGNSGFDSAATVPSNAIENGYANLKNYKGVYSNSAYVDGQYSSLAINTNENAGLLNKENADKYTAILETLGGAGATWDSVFGADVSQPLVITKSTNASNANKDLDYGFIGASTSIAANTYKAVSLRIKTNTVANVYLIDMDTNNFGSTLSIGRNASYWYDDEGNLCVKDPSSDDYSKRTDVAFKLQSNGLYKWNANCKWAGMPALNTDTYYANLSAYGKDSEGNLVVADGGASHDYNSAWDNEGVNGIAFYKGSTGGYFADKACTVRVEDFTKVAGLPTRYDAMESAKELKYTVDGSQTATDWVTVTFYIHTGATAKNYRLEVWSGDRTATAANTKANSYVFVDTNNPGSADSNFDALITEYKDFVDENAYFEDVFSYYDTNKFLRFNSALDENGYGNLYADSYVPSSYYESNGVAYLEYAETNSITIFADYSLADVTVTAASIPTDSEEDNSEEEEEDSTNVWLLASSIAVAAVLVLAVVSIIVRKILESARKKRGAKVRVESVSKPRKEKKAKASKADENSSEESPYND